ncbi:MAG: hypothetical protein LAT66_12530 [Alkalimonas sp.]|nr:hypothetical protein [Alkalimonas sp.]
MMLEFNLTRQAHHVPEPLVQGLPFAKGTLKDERTIRLELHGEELPFEAEVLSYWPDQSIRWLLVRCMLPAMAEPTAVVKVTLASGAKSYPASVSAHEDQAFIEIATGKLQHQICKATGQLRSTTEAEKTGWQSAFQLHNQHGQTLQPLVHSVQLQQSERSLFPKVRLSGTWPGYPKLQFEATLVFFADGLLQLEYSLHNAAKAKHPSGLWDLGDPGSCHFAGLAFCMQGAIDQGFIQPERSVAATSLADGSITLEQNSSGGKNWHSRNHVNADNKLVPRFQGYQLRSAEQQTKGLRAEPLLQASNGILVEAAVPHFWQKFPQQLALSKNQVLVEWFAHDQEQLHELQGGEKSTRQLWLTFAEEATADAPSAMKLGWVYQPARVVIPVDYLASCQIMPWLQPAKEDPLSACLFGPELFFEKREIIDEYGWRNFGDIFADHETLYQPEGEAPYISHYNNQYDAIYGFCRQYFFTGNTGWLELMDDLARHVTDIDIYHTDDDRDEYNHGLFWHTDHYLAAHTATHRTYSKQNLAEQLVNSHGGGPGPEHCYTTGLCYHFWLTGQTASKQAVLELAQWMIRYHEGGQSFLGQLWAIKSNELPRLIRLLKRQHVTAHRYAFTRGTGNYLTALLDAYELSGDCSYLAKSETVIQNTIHPKDNIEDRNLDDPEHTWSYLILLASISKYLKTKQSLEQLDDNYDYAAASFLHYARWIANNEQLFLSVPEKLEYPNDTWLAQDIRKAMLLFQASCISSNTEERAWFAEEANKWLHLVVQQLSKSETLEFARIQIILLQNHGPHLYKTLTETYTEHSIRQQNWKKQNVLFSKEFKSIFTKLSRATLKLNPKKEWQWLRNRLNL